MPSSSSPIPPRISHFPRREPEYYIQLAAVCHHEEIDLPTFCQDDLVWLLDPTLKGQHDASEALLIGVALSVLEDAHPDVLVLSHKQRLLLLQLPEWEEELHEGDHPGLNLLKSLLLCSSPDDIESLDPLQNTPYAKGSVQIASLSASEIAFLLHNSFQADSSILDLDLLAVDMAYDKIPPFNCMMLIRAVLSKKKATSIMSLEPEQFLVKREETVINSVFLSRLIGTARLAIASYEIGSQFADHCNKNISNGNELLNRAKIDTRRIPPRLVGYIARFEAVEVALQVAKPKVGHSRLRKVLSSNGDQNGIEYKLAKDGKTFEVINEQYKSRLARNTRQLLEISLTNKSGESRIYSAKTVSSTGKTSSLEFVGKGSASAVAMLQGGAHASGMSLDSIEIRGREDHSAADIEGMKWRRQMMCCSKEIDGRLSKVCDPAQLLSPFLLGDKPKSAVEILDRHTIRLLDRPERDRYNKIIARERMRTLNPSQARAARAILSPLTGIHLTGKKEDWQTQDRFCLVHGPPGTGKTSLITACCEQWQQSCSNMDSQQEYARDTIYACCQSNVAVKNIAESFSRAKVNFKVSLIASFAACDAQSPMITCLLYQIIVSANFFVEWHEDLYADIMSRFIRADELPTSVPKLAKLLGDCNVMLSTVSFLSSPKIVKGDSPLFKIRPMRLLFVDEASQIHLRAYPHLLQRFGSGIARIVFLGDDKQLPPYQGEEIIDAGLSVFELEHLRGKAFLLDTCYRLATPMAAFISENVYDGLLKCGTNNYNPEGGLLDCASFIDVESSKEEKHGTSRMNREEIKMVVKLVEEYKMRGGAMSQLKVLTSYDAQRDALEEALKKANLSGASDVVFSVDSFQGRESEYIILSLVKDGRPMIQDQKKVQRVVKYLQPGLGFLSNDRRINVALTRAKKGIVIVSNRRFIIDTASETLVGKLQIEMQWLGTGGEEHWWDENDVRNNRMPRALFGLLPDKKDDLLGVAGQLEGIGLDNRCEPNGWD